ncbi:unnamed protein product [Caenorhabditis bovis]|uniref:Endonuclease n=1 Tax=Caenorhabditis bovis TaxID=2654633 RepID=A0A8S1F4N9_9PELO|nr:unnamed protein product [Caenorhabditis bovis]
MYKLIVSTSAVAGISFLLGKYSNDEIFRSAHSATAGVQLARIEVPNMGPQLHQKATNFDAVSRVPQIMKYGYPGHTNLKHFNDYVLSYDTRTRTAHWVCEHLTPESLKRGKDVNRGLSEFQPFPETHEYFRAVNEDYKGSGFDRGHLAAAGNHRTSQIALDQTFFLCNNSPQVGKGFNRDKWNDLEIYCRKLAKNALNTYVVTGPLYLPREFDDGKKYVKYQVIGKNNVAVPTHFFKVVLVETKLGHFEMESFILPNAVIPDSTDIAEFHVPIDAIERHAGFLIFDKFQREKLNKINRKSVGLWQKLIS